MPGLITGSSDQEAHENAFAAFLATGGSLSYCDFVTALDSAGYRSVCFGDGSGHFRYRLQLPTRQPDHFNGADRR